MRPLGYTPVKNDVEAGTPTPTAMNSLFQRNGSVKSAHGETEKPVAAQLKKRMTRLRNEQPRIGAVMAMIATTASAVAPYTATLLTAGGVVAVGASVSLLHDAEATINNIDRTISTGVTQFTSATADSDGQSYMRDLGPGIRSGAGLLEQAHKTNLVPKIASVDFDKLSKLLTKVESSDIEGLLDGVARIVESFDRVSLLANLRFTTDNDGQQQLAGAGAIGELASPPQNETGR